MKKVLSFCIIILSISLVVVSCYFSFGLIAYYQYNVPDIDNPSIMDLFFILAIIQALLCLNCCILLILSCIFPLKKVSVPFLIYYIYSLLIYIGIFGWYFSTFGNAVLRETVKTLLEYYTVNTFGIALIHICSFTRYKISEQKEI
jgi:hypothetical protein